MQYNSFENTVGKGETACNEQFLLFPQCFLPIWITFCHFHQIHNNNYCDLQPLAVWKSLKFVIWERVNLTSLNEPCTIQAFWKHRETRCVCETQMSQNSHFFGKLWSWYVTLTLTDDLDFGRKERALLQGIFMWNMKPLSLTIRKWWPI